MAMSTSFKKFFIVILVMFALPGLGQTQKKAQQFFVADTAAIRNLVMDYCKSISLADTTLARRVWSLRESITFIDPRGHSHGWPQIRDQFYQETMAGLFSKRDLKVVSLTIHPLTREVAWLEFYWKFNAVLRENNQPVATSGRETQILIKENGDWRIVHIHYSGLPVNAQGQGF